jgi:hypothetical protein
MLSYHTVHILKKQKHSKESSDTSDDSDDSEQPCCIHTVNPSLLFMATLSSIKSEFQIQVGFMNTSQLFTLHLPSLQSHLILLWSMYTISHMEYSLISSTVYILWIHLFCSWLHYPQLNLSIKFKLALWILLCSLPSSVQSNLILLWSMYTISHMQYSKLISSTVYILWIRLFCSWLHYPQLNLSIKFKWALWTFLFNVKSKSEHKLRHLRCEAQSQLLWG